MRVLYFSALKSQNITKSLVLSRVFIDLICPNSQEEHFCSVTQSFHSRLTALRGQDTLNNTKAAAKNSHNTQMLYLGMTLPHFTQ